MKPEEAVGYSWRHTSEGGEYEEKRVVDGVVIFDGDADFHMGGAQLWEKA